MEPSSATSPDKPGSVLAASGSGCSSARLRSDAPRLPKPCSPNYFLDYLSRRWEEGCVRGRERFYEIKLRGYTGSFSHLERLLAKWRRANDAKVVTLPPVPEPTDSADNDDRDGPPRRRSLDWEDDLANRRRFAMHLAAWFVDAASGGKGRRSEKRSRRTSPPCVGSPCDPEAFSEAKTFRKFGVWLDDAQQSGIYATVTLRSNGAARSRRRHKRVDQRLEQWPNRRAHQSIEDPQAQRMYGRAGFFGTPTRPDVASPLADSARKVRQTLIIRDALGEEQPLDPVDVFHSLANERLALPADPAAVFLFGCRRLDHRAHPRLPAFVG